MPTPVVQLVANRYIDLDQYEVFDKAIGFQATDILTGFIWILSVSQDPVDHETVEAVFGKPDLRWLRETPSGAIYEAGPGVEIDDSDPDAPVILATPGQNPCRIYVAPYGEGDDTADGLTPSTMVNTAYVGLQKIIAAGGGTLTLSNGWRARADVVTDPPTPGNMAGYGIWLRGDGVTAEGWLPSVPLVIEGVGVSPDILFAPPGMATGKAGCATNNYAPLPNPFPGTFPYRSYPGIWISKTVDRITIDGVALQDSVYCPVRIGVDYFRNASDGSPQFITATSATRAAGEVTFTLTLPTAIPIAQLQRTSNVVTATVSSPSAKQTFPPWRVGTVVRITSTDPGNFPSVDATILSVVANVDSSSDWSFTYAQSGADHTSANPASVQSHGCAPGEFLDFNSTIPQIAATQYRVASCTADTVTVTDPYGGAAVFGGTLPASGTWANPGALAHQERMYTAVMGAVVKTFAANIPGDATFGEFYGGPTIDIGVGLAVAPVIEQCQVQGLSLADLGGDAYPRDEVRMAAIAVTAGSPANPIETAVVILNSYAANGGLYQEAPANGSDTRVINFLGEAASGPVNPPVVRVLGNYDSDIYIDNARVADIQVGLPEVIVDGLNPLTPPNAQRTTVLASGIDNEITTSFGAPVYAQIISRTTDNENGNAAILLDSNQAILGAVPIVTYTDGPGDDITLATDWAVDTAAANSTDIDLANVHFGPDGTDYEFEMQLDIDASSAISLQPNSLTTNQESYLVGWGAGGSIGGGPFSDLRLGANTGAAVYNIRGSISQPVGLTRQWSAEVVQLEGGNRYTYKIMGTWSATTVITGFRVHCSTGSGINSGTVRTRQR